MNTIYNEIYNKKLPDKKFLIAEHCSRGSGIINLLNNFFYVCLITKKYKHIYSNRLSEFDLSKMSKGYYLFKNDNNLYKKQIKLSKTDVIKIKSLLDYRIKHIKKKINQLEYKWL